MQIRPFQGYRFDGQVVGDVGRCVAPPYDVIDEALQQRLYERSEYNIVRVSLGKTTPQDNEQNNRYTRAAACLTEWISSGVLKQDPTERIYGYVQDFDLGARHYRRSGMVALGELEEFGRGVQPHEKTLDGPKADRLRLMLAKAAQLGQIFMLYDDPQRVDEQVMTRAATHPMLLDFLDDAGVRHRLYAIDEPEDMRQVADMMSTKSVVIADGHHRYETALEYYRRTQNPAARFRMMMFVNMRNEGLQIFPTHRLVRGLAAFDPAGLLARLAQRFEMVDFAFGVSDKVAARDRMFEQIRTWCRQGRNAFGLYMATDHFYALALRDSAVLEARAPELSPASRALDVNVLHKLVLDDLLGIGERQLADESHLEYVKDLGDAIDASIERVDRRECQAAFFMNPTRVEQVKAVAAAGERMPQKSTFFYPKLYTGLVLHKL
ncbi:MAG TPA: DUF1015 domain-containing protein [Phycisphaerales bacterium]|nr:DUF1015 domain-containing protein [Phycisphaerales bacterium]